MLIFNQMPSLPIFSPNYYFFVDCFLLCRRVLAWSNFMKERELLLPLHSLCSPNSQLKARLNPGASSRSFMWMAGDTGAILWCFPGALAWSWLWSRVAWIVTSTLRWDVSIPCRDLTWYTTSEQPFSMPPYHLLRRLLSSNLYFWQFGHVNPWINFHFLMLVFYSIGLCVCFYGGSILFWFLKLCNVFQSQVLWCYQHCSFFFGSRWILWFSDSVKNIIGILMVFD